MNEIWFSIALTNVVGEMANGMFAERLLHLQVVTQVPSITVLERGREGGEGGREVGGEGRKEGGGYIGNKSTHTDVHIYLHD